VEEILVPARELAREITEIGTPLPDESGIRARRRSLGKREETHQGQSDR
jgi:hypothetical protein